MSFFHLLFAEIRFRWLNFVLGVLAVAAAATTFVAGPTLVAGYQSETEQILNQTKQETETRLAEMDKKTKRLMRDIGFNLRIVHADTNMADYHTKFEAVDMPQQYIYDLAKSDKITKMQHLVATLWAKIQWNDREVLLAGVLPEVASDHLEKKQPMGHNIPPGKVFVGYDLRAGLKEGGRVTVLGKTFTVAKILPPTISREDIVMWVNLADAQEMLNKPGKITEIVALGCNCQIDQLSEVTEQVMQVLPGVRVSEHQSNTLIRAGERKLVEEGGKKILGDKAKEREAFAGNMTSLLGALTPLAVIAAGLVVGLLAWINVRERRPEIGVLRALGKKTSTITALFFSKALLLGLLAGIVGAAAGFLVAQSVGATLEIASDFFQPNPLLLLAAVIGAPLVAMLATYPPTLAALRQDPSLVLHEV